eukprot:SAG11_NODE_23687_length_384_cov_1.242105_1_plen_44_part_10
MAVIYPEGAEDVTKVITDGRWLTVEATVAGSRFAVTSLYLPSKD